MQIEIVIIAAIIFTVMTVSGQISIAQLVSDNEAIFRRLKEEDWEFYVRARYGDNVNSTTLFNQRIRNGLMAAGVAMLFFINDFSALSIVISLLAGYFIFKQAYSQLKTFYKRNMFHIDQMLPHYLKSIEILIQHYTIPVALGKSIDDAPEIFRPGLRELIIEINTGNDSIDPYMNFAKKYPVRDSMRMMRLLYRLSLGRQERKQEQLLTFSKSISSLQQKSRDTRYKNRLEKMEGKTMKMLMATGLGVMILLILAVLQMMNG